MRRGWWLGLAWAALQLGCGAHVEAPVQRLGAGFEEGVAEVQGIRLHHVQGGKGPTVLLIPGFLQTWYAWRDVMPALVGAGFHVVVVDPRGMGDSSRPANGYDTGRVAADLHGMMRQLGHERYAVAGHDIGVWIGYALAGDHPEAVERLALIEGSLPGLLGVRDVFMPQKDSVFFWHFLFNQQQELPELLITGRERPYMAWIFEHWSYKHDAIALDTYAKAYAEPGAISAQLAYYRAFPETMAQNQKRATQKLSMPVLALGGDHAKGNAQLAMVQPLASDVRGGVLRDCGHFAPEECSGALAEQLVSFLRQ